MMLGVWVAACTWPGPTVPEEQETAVVAPSPDDLDTALPPVEDLTAEVVLGVHSDMATMPVVSWQQLVAVDESWLSWDFDGAIHTSPVEPREVGPASEVLLGLPPETTVQVTMHGVIAGVERTWALGPVETGRLPTDLPPAVLGIADPALHRTEPWLLTTVDVGPVPFFGPSYTVILDLKGRIVWYRKTGGGRLTWQPQVSRRGGYILLDESDDFRRSEFVKRLTLDLTQQGTIEIPSWGSAFDELEDGSILYDEAENLVEFHLAHLDLDGNSTRLWSCFPWMNDFTDETWGCAPSSIRVDPIRNTILWSMFKTSTVVELSLEGDFLAEYGRYPFNYKFDPPSTNFDAQHFPVFTASDRLLVSTHDRDGSGQYIREYVVDEEDNTLRAIRSIPTDRYAVYGGQAQQLPSGNFLWELGSAGSIQELLPDGTVVWEAGWERHLVGHVTPIADLYALTTGW
jgi:hypothetical protein